MAGNYSPKNGGDGAGPVDLGRLAANLPATLPEVVANSIKCGPPIKFRNWRAIPPDDRELPEEFRRTEAERAMRFVECFLKIPDGPHVGAPMKLLEFQEALFYQVVDTDIWTMLYSMARKNAKTATVAALLLAYIVGPLARQNDEIASAANSREQASHVYKYAAKMLALNPMLGPRYRLVPSQKLIFGTSKEVTYKSISSEVKTAHGGNYRLIVMDELGQVRGPSDDFYDALVTGQGAQLDPKLVIISTQAPSDAALFSTLIDHAIASDAKDTAVHLYAAEADCAMDDPEQWAAANPALHYFRSLEDIQRQAADALAMHSAASRFRNLVLNQRVAAESLFIAPDTWKKNNGAPSMEVAKRCGIQIGLDLSQKTDLTAAVCAARDEDGELHIWTHAFAPRVGLEARGVRDKVPYGEWHRAGLLHAPDGEVVDYEAVCVILQRWIEENELTVIRVAFDRWRINEFKRAAERAHFANDCPWVEVGQGFKDMSPRVESFETALLRKRVHHGSHPALNMAASCAVVVTDPAGGRKLDKTRATQRIDPLVAALMASHEVLTGDEVLADVSHWIA